MGFRLWLVCVHGAGSYRTQPVPNIPSAGYVQLTSPTRKLPASMLRRAPEFRIAVLGVIMLALVGVLAGRLWYVQVARGDEYTARIRGNSQVNVRLPAVRGEILDRRGEPLVQNRASFTVDFYLPDIVRAYREQHGTVPRQSYRTTVGGMMTDKSE